MREVAVPFEVHAPPFHEYSYAVTPTLSEDAAQLAVAEVAVTELNPGVPGVVGATPAAPFHVRSRACFDACVGAF